MKIALITPYKNYSGGVESVNQILIDIFHQEGYEVELITSENFKINIYTALMIKIIGLPYITAKKFKKNEKQYDVVIANGEYAWGITHPRCINIFHGCYKGYRDYLKKIWSKKIYFHLTKDSKIQKLGSRNKYIVCVSEFIKSILEKDGIRVDKVINNSIDLTLFKPIEKYKTNKYIFVGSYNYYAKGFDVLEKISVSDNKIKIDCVTDKKPSELLGWIRNVDNSFMPQIYNQYRMLIFPSRFEGLALAPLEAMACGLPVVMSNVGLGPELKKIIPEFVVDGDNEKDYICKIEHIEKNYKIYSEKAINYVKKYHSYEVYRKNWIELVEKIANA